MAFNPQELFTALNEQVSQILPESAKMAQEDVKSQVQFFVSAMLEKLDLVTREEFDAQQLVLERTREKLDALEKQLAEIESNLPLNES